MSHDRREKVGKSSNPLTYKKCKLLVRGAGNLLLFGTAVCCVLAFSARLGAQDFSNLENVPKVESAKTLTRGINPSNATNLHPTRNYLPDRGIVIVEEADGTQKQEPYVVLPILFKKDSDELLDIKSQSTLQTLAEFLKRPSLSGARFCVEGHTSTEGTHEYNVDLSKRRANRIFSLLTGQFAVDPSNLRQEGFGPDAPEVKPERTEQDRQRNRRVVVVREE